MNRWLWLSLSLSAVTSSCERGREPIDCETALSSFWQRSTSEPSTKAVFAAAVASCRETAWSADVLSCMQGAETNDDRNRCIGMLTTDQRAAMDRATAMAGV